jgi:hypothetical protein
MVRRIQVPAITSRHRLYGVPLYLTVKRIS